MQSYHGIYSPYYLEVSTNSLLTNCAIILQSLMATLHVEKATVLISVYTRS